MTSLADKKTIRLKGFLGLIAAMLGFYLMQYAMGPPSIDKQLSQLASKTNEACPTMIDKETRLDNTLSPKNKEFQYNYTLVNHTKEEINQELLEEQVKPKLINLMRTNPDCKYFRDNEVTVIYNYVDKAGVFLLRITLTPKDYNQ